MPLETGSNRRTGDIADGLMHAVWSRACVHLKDANGRRVRVKSALERVPNLAPEWQVRVCLNLARGADDIGEKEEALTHLGQAEDRARAFPLLAWRVLLSRSRSMAVSKSSGADSRPPK